MRFWNLPGPQAFCEQAEDILRDNKNLVIALPNLGTVGFIDAFCRQLDCSGWNRLSIEELPSLSPVDCLFDQLGLETAAMEKRTPLSLTQKLEPGQIIIIDGIGAGQWLPWKEFIAEYELVCRNKGGFERSLIVAVVRGVEVALLPKADIALGILIWQGILSELDMLSYAGIKLRAKGVKSGPAQLVATTIARLAQWDVNVADTLLEAPMQHIFSPRSILAKVADSYGWAKDSPMSWENGVIDLFDGRKQTHSAFLAINDPTGELNMRVWSSQASSLLPLIELHRRELISKFKHRLKLPISVGDEQIHDAFDLEIGTLAYLAGKMSLDVSTQARLRKLRNVRNKLAHLEVLDANLALDPELLNAWSLCGL